MIYKKIMIYFLLGIWGYYYTACHAVTIGSDTSVDIITPAPTFVGQPNQILTFAFCKDGFTLSDQETSCDYYSTFPVNGPVVLNGGEVTLFNDLHFTDETTPLTYGWFVSADPNKRCHVELPQRKTSLVSNSQIEQLIFEDVDLIVHEGLDLVKIQMRFFGQTCTIRGDGPEASSITFDEFSNIYAEGAATLIIENVTLKNVGHPENIWTIFCSAAVGSLVLKNVKIVQSGDYRFSSGFLTIMDDCVITATSSEGFSFTYDSNKPLSIEHDSSILVDKGMTFKYDGATGMNDRIHFSDQTSKIILNNATFRGGNNNIKLMKGTLEVRGTSFLASDLAQQIELIDPVNNLSVIYFNQGTLGLTMGDVGEGDFFLSVEPAAQLIVTQNTTLTLQNTSSDAIQLGESSAIRFQAGSFFYPRRAWVVNQGKVAFEDLATILKLPSVHKISGNVVYEGKVYWITLP